MAAELAFGLCGHPAVIVRLNGNLNPKFAELAAPVFRRRSAASHVTVCLQGNPLFTLPEPYYKHLTASCILLCCYIICAYH